MRVNEAASEETPLVVQQQSQPFAKKFIFLSMGLLVVYVIIRGVFAAATKPFWFDELVTLTLSTLPTMKAAWGALARALDSPPPGFYVIQRSVVGLLQNKQISLRLVSIFAFPCALICVFLYVRKRSGEAIGFICALLLLLTSVFYRYASEGRPYSMVFACFAFALLCYQRVPAPLWTALLALTLALAQSLHYYAIFAMAPFGLAEAVFFLRTRKFRWPVWLALLVGAAPLAIFWPLLANIRTQFGTHFFEDYSFSALPATYGTFFQTDAGFGAAVVAVSITGIVGSRLLRRPKADSSSRINDTDVAEAVLLFAFVLLPIITYSVIRVMHGGMRDAYVLTSILGIVLAFGAALSLARPQVVLLFTLFIVSTIGIREFRFWRSTHSLHFTSPTDVVEEFVQNSGYSNLPVVVSSGMKYTPLAHYASPVFYKRLFYLTDQDKQFQYQGADTFDKNVAILRDYMPLQVEDFTEFTAAHPEFLLYTEEPDDAGTWLPIYLSRRASMRAVAVHPVRRLYLVTITR
jgi:hypothetical protein